ncbi:hypothetical protein TanjilG_01068 [Lupinus angustifolius]|uniref:Uncharacterized protein n=1 Tax=Lupinus angustifolius TaxID=3871 RepID=A0A1J7IKN2_LUPAN|nr:hypothetical protein TanjilG_01068 [Lupinus angustifolius]
MKDRLSTLARVGGAEFNKGPWQARPSEIRSLRTFFLDMDQAPTSFLALARKRSRSPPTNKIGECIKSTSFIDGRVPTGQRFGFMHYTRLRGGSYKAYSRQGLPASKRWKRLYLLMFSPTGILPLPLKFWLAFPDLGVLTAEQYGMVRAFIMERNNGTTASLRIESCECMVGPEPEIRDSAFKNSLPAILSCVKIAFRPVLFLSWKRRQEQSLLIHLFANLLVGYPHSVTRIGLWREYPVHRNFNQKRLQESTVGKGSKRIVLVASLRARLFFEWKQFLLVTRPFGEESLSQGVRKSHQGDLTRKLKPPPTSLSVSYITPTYGSLVAALSVAGISAANMATSALFGRFVKRHFWDEGTSLERGGERQSNSLFAGFRFTRSPLSSAFETAAAASSEPRPSGFSGFPCERDKDIPRLTDFLFENREPLEAKEVIKLHSYSLAIGSTKAIGAKPTLILLQMILIFLTILPSDLRKWIELSAVLFNNSVKLPRSSWNLVNKVPFKRSDSTIDHRITSAMERPQKTRQKKGGQTRGSLPSKAKRTLDELMRMGVSLAARKHPVLTTLRDTKAQVTPVGEVALSIPSAYPRPDRQLLDLPISPKLPPVFGPSCMRQKLAPRTVRRPSPTPAVMVRLRSTNTKKIQFTQRLPLGSELHMGKERCCFRGLDHLHGPTSHSIFGNLMIYKPSLTNDRLMFEHDESLRADLLPINFPASYENGKLEHFLHRWMKNREHNNLWLTMFPEKRYFRERTSTTEVAIHTNPFTDRYASIGTGSSRTGGCLSSFYRYEMQYPHTSLHGFRPGREEARDCPMKDKLAGCRGQEGRTPRKAQTETGKRLTRTDRRELACYRLTDLLSSLIGFLAWNAFVRVRIRKTAWIGERGNLTALLIEKAWADPQPLAHYKIKMTNWLELQRDKGESAHDAWKVGHNLVAATSQAHQMQTWLLLALARPSTASTADAADLDVPSIAKEVAELVLWDLDSDFPYSSNNPMGNPSLSAPEPNESVWYAEASPYPEIGRKQTLLEDKKGWDKDLSFKSRRKWKGSSLCLACSKLRS